MLSMDAVMHCAAQPHLTHSHAMQHAMLSCTVGSLGKNCMRSDMMHLIVPG